MQATLTSASPTSRAARAAETPAAAGVGGNGDARERRVFEMFDRAYTNSYGTDRGKLWVDRYPPGAAAYANLVNARNRRVVELCAGGGSVLDIGAGYGDLLYLLRDKYRSLHGVDPSGATVELATENLRVRRVEAEYRFQQGVAENLPFESGAFQTVTCLDTYEHIDPGFRHAALLEARRVLEPGGSLILVTPSRARLRLWTIVDNVLTLRRQLRAWRNPKLRRPVEWAKFPKRDFCEVFCSSRELRGELRAAGFRVERFERVSFYPAPERGGLIYPYVENKPAEHWLVRATLGLVRLGERLRWLNQKMLVVATPSDTSGAIGARSGTDAGTGRAAA